MTLMQILVETWISLIGAWKFPWAIADYIVISQAINRGDEFVWHIWNVCNSYTALARAIADQLHYIILIMKRWLL
jgi:hypothetical protein